MTTIRVLFSAVAMALAVTALAQSDSAFTFNQGVFSNMMMQPNMDRMLKRNMELALGKRPDVSLRSRGYFKPSSSLQSSTVLEGEVTGAFASKLSSSYPAANRAEAERVFRELLKGYGKIERQFGISRHDVAGSVAAFIAGSYMGYRNTDFPDENFKPLVTQMRQILGTNPDFANASNAEKQEMYEQMAIIGMFMAGTQMALKEKPNPQIAANMKQAAKGYLEQFLKTDAERVQITAQGLVLR
jgi:hypothetical protein